MYPARYYPSAYYSSRYYERPGIAPASGSGYYPVAYYARRYWPKSYYPGTNSQVPGNGAGYYAGPYYARRYWASRYYPGTTSEGPASGNGYYPQGYYAPFYWPFRYYPSSTPQTLPASLVAASIAWMRTDNSGRVAALFGDSVSTPKFWSDESIGASLPFLVFDELTGNRAFESGGAWVESGTIAIRIFAAPKTLARSLGDAVIKSLKDAPLAFSGATLMFWRPRQPMFAPNGEVTANGVPSEYIRVVAFDYIIDGAPDGNPVG